MNLILDPWVYDPKDFITTIWRSIANGFIIGSTEGMLIYMVVKLFS
ncbi:hypothetical protein [Sulfuricurvum sp.]|nr:hypothetical protein [Sulfuricurvum sp.]HEX5329525.1 hypothetical protein [Sulfuricurvum sp.]